MREEDRAIVHAMRRKKKKKKIWLIDSDIVNDLIVLIYLQRSAVGWGGEEWYCGVRVVCVRECGVTINDLLHSVIKCHSRTRLAGVCV